MTVGRNNRIFCIHFQTKQVKSWLAPEKFFHERSNAISFVRVLRRYLGNNILWKKKFFFILTNLTLIFSFSFEKKNKYKASRVRDNFYKQIYLLRFSLEKWTNTKQISNIDQISLSLVNIFIFIDGWISKEKNYNFSVRKIEIRNLFFWKRRKEEFVFSKLWITQERKLSAKQSSRVQEEERLFKDARLAFSFIIGACSLLLLFKITHSIAPFTILTNRSLIN